MFLAPALLSALDVTACYSNTIIGKKIVWEPIASLNEPHSTYIQSIQTVCMGGVKVASLPEANFTYFPYPPLEDQLVNFDASSSKPNGGDIVSYKWDFGDESPVAIETDPITTHVYTEVGPYTVNLTVTDSEGFKGTKSELIRVLRKPSSVFTYLPKDPVEDEALTFNASASKDEDGEIVSYAWDFGDGSPVVIKTDPIISHAFRRGGNYTVKLVVTDDDNLTDTATDDIVVSPLLVHDIAVINVTVSRNTAKIGESVSISTVVINEGNFSETFNVTIYYGNHVIEAKSVANLPVGVSQTLNVTWNTTGVSRGEYAIRAVASVPDEEENYTNDNTYIDGTVVIVGEEALPPNVFSYVLAAVAIIIIAIIALYFLRARKQA